MFYVICYYKFKLMIINKFRKLSRSILFVGMIFFFFSCEKNNVQDTAIGCQVDGGVCLEDHSCCENALGCQADGGVCLDDHSCCSGLDNINSSK